MSFVNQRDFTFSTKLRQIKCVGYVCTLNRIGMNFSFVNSNVGLFLLLKILRTYIKNLSILADLVSGWWVRRFLKTLTRTEQLVCL